MNSKTTNMSIVFKPQNLVPMKINYFTVFKYMYNDGDNHALKGNTDVYHFVWATKRLHFVYIALQKIWEAWALYVGSNC